MAGQIKKSCEKIMIFFTAPFVWESLTLCLLERITAVPSKPSGPFAGRNFAEVAGIGPTVKQRTLTPAFGPIKIKNFKSTGLSIQRTLLHNLPRRGAFFYSYLRRQAPPSPSEPYEPSEPFY